ncbi:hypothetical protein LBMAG21_14850 [Armatimonadota bacterium]|nr:hypothetical protein LBMAG21_14850 [Armatimonadota bacterium]
MPLFPHPKGYVCYRADSPVTIDGNLNKLCWSRAPWTSYFRDIEGDSQPIPRFRTRAKMLWDDRYLYIGAYLEEPHVWGTLTTHDSVIFQDNDFEIFIDPDGDLHQYYEIEINALNTEWDLRLVKPYRDGGPALNEWEIPGMKSAIRIDGTLNDPTDTDKGWSVEMALPWTALAEFANRLAPPQEGDQWRINFSRVEWDIRIEDGRYVKIPNRPEHNWVWSPQGVIDMHRPEHWGYVQFTSQPAGSVKFRKDPAHPLRAWLIGVYYAQHAYHAAHQRYAASLDELQVSYREITGVHEAPSLLLTKEGYLVTAKRHRQGRKSEIWHIQQDSRLWQEPEG